MKVLQVIHGYPPYYMAGSEVYTYNLVNELKKHIDVSVFTRIENPYDASYTYFDEKVGNEKIRRINKPERDYTLMDKYLDAQIDRLFTEYVEQEKPDVVHVGHLSHLSTNIVNIASEQFDLPVVFTIHDFWMFCPRGQLIDPDKRICESITAEMCTKCLQRSFKDTMHRSDYEKYREHMQNVIDNIDVFLSPSMFLKKFYENMGVLGDKVIFSKYGFDKKLIHKKTQSNSTIIRFGFMGRVIPVKGILQLLMAFKKLDRDNARLSIFGGMEHRKYLERYAVENVKFEGPYYNGEINDVLDKIDVLVVPSIWYENSPLVIQEAFIAGIPVITSDIGGMRELVRDRENGLTFRVGDVDDLASKMRMICDCPEMINSLRPSGEEVRSIEEDSARVLSVYRGLC